MKRRTSKEIMTEWFVYWMFMFIALLYPPFIFNSCGYNEWLGLLVSFPCMGYITWRYCTQDD